ncbi:hypothetical protein [Streptomyces bluensis]
MRVRMAIAELCESLLLALVRTLLPTQGRHRATHSPPVRPHHLDGAEVAV